MADFNLDDKLDEVRDEWTVQANGRTFRFPGTLSVNRLRAFAPDVERLQQIVAGKGDVGSLLDLIEAVLKPLAGPDQSADLLEHVGIGDVQRIIVWLFEKYGLGEASASSASSENTGTSSRQTSKGSTDSNSTGSSTAPATDTPAGSSA